MVLDDGPFGVAVTARAGELARVALRVPEGRYGVSDVKRLLEDLQVAVVTLTPERDRCAPWCEEHDEQAGQCVSGAREAGRVSVWLVRAPGGEVSVTVDTPPSGTSITPAEARDLAAALDGLALAAGVVR